MHLPSCSTFDWLYVLSPIDLFIVAFNFTIIDLGNSITLNGKFPSLPVSTLCGFFVLFWLVPDYNLVNITNLCYWMSRISYSLSQVLCYSWLIMLWGLPLLYGYHACVQATGVLVLFVSSPLTSDILLWSGSSYLTCHMSYQMPGTASACVLHHSIDRFLFCTLFSALWVPVCFLSWLFYPFLYGQNLSCFSCHLMFFLCSLHFHSLSKH